MSLVYASIKKCTYEALMWMIIAYLSLLLRWLDAFLLNLSITCKMMHSFAASSFPDPIYARKSGFLQYFLCANESDFTNFDGKKLIRQLNHASRKLPRIFSNITYSSDDLSIFKAISSSNRIFVDYQPTGLKLKSQENRKIRGKFCIFLPKTRRVLEICCKILYLLIS